MEGEEEKEVVHLQQQLELALAELLLCKELIEEILSRLPVKSLLRFKCVSKSWLSLISSERFIESHRQNSTKNRAFSHHKVIFECKGDVFKQYSVQQLMNAASSIEPYRIQHPTNNLLLRAYVVGCCNGLLCLINYQRYQRYQRGLFLWNPSTMIFMELPNLKDLVYEKFGFGWDGRSGAYKVFALSNHREICKGNVYSSKTNLWKTVDRGCLLPVYDINGVFACGKIHWVTTQDYIESFDLGSEEFGRIDLPFNLPECHYGQYYKLAEIGGCLHLACVDITDKQTYVVIVWVLKESGWLKLYTFPPCVFEHRYFLMRPVFGGGPNGEIFLIISDKFLFYNGKDVIVLPVSKNIEYVNRGRVYVESLVSPNFTAAS